MTRLASALSLAALALTLAPMEADAQTVTFRVRIAAPVASAAPVVHVQPFSAPYPLAERTAIQRMWSSMESQLVPVARECAMPVGVEIDASSFHGRMVAGTDDGLHPGTRARFRDMARALTALCHRGGAERDAVRGRIHNVRFGFTDNPQDEIAIQGDTLVYRTNGDLGGSPHLGYAALIQWLTQAL